jgi:hypothetical protein
MRIFIQPPHAGGSVDQSVRTAHELLHNSKILSARPGGVIYDRGVVLIEAAEVTHALAVLKEAGMRAFLD